VSGELSSRDAWLDGLSFDQDVCSVKARLPAIEVPSFEAWLRKFTHGTGRVVTVSE